MGLTVPTPIAGPLNGLQGRTDHKHRKLQRVDTITPNDLICLTVARNQNLVFTNGIFVLLKRNTKSYDYFFPFSFKLAIQYSTGYDFLHNLTHYLLSGGEPTSPPVALQFVRRAAAELQQLDVLRCWQIAMSFWYCTLHPGNFDHLLETGVLSPCSIISGERTAKGASRSVNAVVAPAQTVG